MRRLPICFLVDTCLSMKGKPIEMVENCINGVIKNMKRNPNAIETNVVNVISYGNNKITYLEKYKSITDINYQKFNCTGFSNINYALNAVIDDYKNNFKETTPETKGDIKPMLFIFSGIALNSKIDKTLLDFVEMKFGNGYIDYIESYIDQDFANISSFKKYKNIFIVTSDNQYAVKCFNEYFHYICSYCNVDDFVNKFNVFINRSEDIFSFSEKVNSETIKLIKEEGSTNIKMDFELPPPPTNKEREFPI